MNAILSFVRTFPGLSVGIAALIVMLPIILNLIQFVLSFKGAM